MNENQQHLFRKPIRAVFKRNAKLQSPPQISTALQLGYEVSQENYGAWLDALTRVQTLEGLHHGVRRQRILNRIFELAAPPKKSTRPDLPSSPRIKTARAQKTLKRLVAPHPGATRTLNRPFPVLSGRRHVPVLVNANRVPFLRLKKPQPPFLSRIIRDTVATREVRIARAERLTDELSIAEDEDQWDQILYEHFSLDYRDHQEDPWEREVKRAIDKNHKSQVEAIQKRADIAAEMYAIVEKEKALAEEEKWRIRDEKHKARKARRLGRRGSTEPEIQEKLCTQTERTVKQDGPSETEEVPKEGQEGVRQPGTEQVWRKRGDKYRTSDELRRLYEASLLPRTDEEIAKIKQARARRKEEESERKAEKQRRKQEIAALCDQSLNEKAKHSTIERAARRIRMDYSNIQRQTKASPLLKELQEASGVALDTAWSAEKPGHHRLNTIRPSLFNQKFKTP